MSTAIEMSGILAHYDTLGATRAAIERLREAGHSDLDVFSPFPAPELEEAMGIESSPVRRWALIGGITGFATATALTGLTAMAYPLVTQGKPILSWPAFFVIMFEMTILFTGLFGFAMQGMSDGVIEFGQTWFWLAIVVWLVMNGVLHAVLLPAERATLDTHAARIRAQLASR